MSSKAIQIAKDIDLARCNGNWSALPELGRRYKKYNPEGAILEQTILAENSLVQVLTAARASSVTYDSDSPLSITMETRVQPEQLLSIQNQLRATLQLSDPNNVNHAQKEFAKIILARTHFECGQYDDALEIIEQLSFEKEQVSQGYGLVLFLQARSIKAISLELTGQTPAAIQSYEGIEGLLSENSGAKCKPLVEWGEEALYRAILWGHRDDVSFTVSSFLEIMRQYQMLMAVQPPHWRVQKRLKATRYSLSFISSVYREGQYTLPVGTADHPDTQQLEQQCFIVEQSQLHTIYEKMLYLEVPLPKAGQVNRPVLDFIDQFASDFELIGTTAYDLRGFVEVLDRASQRTFNSHSITRHLFLALVRLGEYDEAEHALESYLYLVGLVSHGWKEARQNGDALATDKTGLNIPVPVLKYPVVFEGDIEQDEPDSIADIKKSEQVNVVQVLELLIVAIKMYCKDLDKGVDAVEIAEIARALYQEQPKGSRDTSLKELGANVYRAVGAAYGLLGCQTFDQDLRPSYHEKALVFLQHSVELNPESWETYYQLALQQAEMHDVGQAFQSITKALQINSSHLPSWHLFTLIVSCPGQGDFKQALKTCQVGLQQSDMGEFSDNQTNQSGYNGAIKTWGHDESEYHILFQMTRTLLLFALNGPESALESSETLFTSYGRIAVPENTLSSSEQDQLSYGGAHNGMIISGSLGNLNELQTATESRHRRGRSGSHGTDISGSYLGSRSHENVTKEGGVHTLVPGRARSASNLSSRVTPLSNPSQTLTVPGQEEKHHHHHHLHGIHLFSSRSSSRLKSSDAQSLQLPQESQNSSQSLTTGPYGDLKSVGVSSVTSLHSIAPSITSTQSILQPTNVPSKPSVRTLHRKERSELILSNLWLLTADMFIKLGKLDEAHKAIEEAEKVNCAGNPYVWCVLGQLLLSQGDIEQAQASFSKGLTIHPNDVRCHLWLAKTHVMQESFEMAEGILNTLTKTNGWDCAEAWFFLGEIYRKTQRLDRTKACLFYALELESTTPIQPFSIVPRFV